MRGFVDMGARGEALGRFYGGPAWKAHREAANATMVDSDNALLLRPLSTWPGPIAGGPGGLYTVELLDLAGCEVDAFGRFFETTMRPCLERAGYSVFASFASHDAENNFPPLPVRPDRVFGWLARWPSGAALADARAAVAASSGWRDAADPAVLAALARKPELLRLVPTQRSLLA